MSTLSISITTEARLKAWGRWCVETISWGLGYHRSNVLHQLIEAKGERVSANETTLAPYHEAAEEVENLVQRLGESHPHWAQVIYMHYTHKGSIRAKAARLALKPTTYMYYLNQSRQTIEAGLTY